ncbi:hypothetical protein GF402_03375 [Candidatus Fermentibacteria bacterium]|nr:hypothetical protein [Candidatus Fermentibacteria bacterium]
MGLSVALSDTCDVLLVGPAGSGRGTWNVRTGGFFTAQAAVEHVECGGRPEGDFALVALKAYDVSSAANAVSRCCGRIVCFSNGMGLEKEFGAGLWARVEPAVLSLGFLVDDSREVTVSPGEVIVSEGGEAARLFRDTRMPVREVDNIETYRWAKWLVNSAINPLGALTSLRNNELRDAELSGVVDGMVSELKAIIPDDLRPGATDIAGSMLDMLLSESGNRCSMLQDLQAGKRTEIDYLTGLAGDSPEKAPLAVTVTALVRARERRSSS